MAQERLYHIWEVRQVALLVSDRTFSDELLRDIDRNIEALDHPLGLVEKERKEENNVD